MAQTTATLSMNPADMTTADMTRLVAEQEGVIPDNIEYALYSYITGGKPDAFAIQEIVGFYAMGNTKEATKALDMLDGKLDGKFFNTPLDGAAVPRRRMKLPSDPD